MQLCTFVDATACCFIGVLLAEQGKHLGESLWLWPPINLCPNFQGKIRNHSAFKSLSQEGRKDGSRIMPTFRDDGSADHLYCTCFLLNEICLVEFLVTPANWATFMTTSQVDKGRLLEHPHSLSCLAMSTGSVVRSSVWILMHEQHSPRCTKILLGSNSHSSSNQIWDNFLL